MFLSHFFIFMGHGWCMIINMLFINLFSQMGDFSTFIIELQVQKKPHKINLCLCRLASVQVKVESLSVQVQSPESQREGERYRDQ